MILEAINSIKNELDAFLRVKLEVDESMAIISAIIEPGGIIPAGNQNKIVLTLINIQTETSIAQLGFSVDTGAAHPCTNLLIMVSAWFMDYQETLRCLSVVVDYFQSKTTFDHENTPMLNPAIDKLVIEPINLSAEELGSIWGAIGTGCLPSRLYKMKIRPVQAQA